MGYYIGKDILIRIFFVIIMFIRTFLFSFFSENKDKKNNIIFFIFEEYILFYRYYSNYIKYK